MVRARILQSGVRDLLPQTAHWLQRLSSGDAAAAVAATGLITALPAEPRRWGIDHWLGVLPMLLGLDHVVYHAHLGRLAGGIPAGPILAETDDVLLLRRGPLLERDRVRELAPDAPQALLLGVMTLDKTISGAAVSVEAPPFLRPPSLPSTIGFVPALEAADEVEFQEIAPVGPGRSGIRVAPKPDARLRARIVASTLRCLDRADWVMLPESCVDPQTHLALVAALAARQAASGLVIAGSGCHDGFNRVHVLGPGGRELWTQDKLRLWAVPQDRVAAWLGQAPQHPSPHDEATDIGRTVTLIDLPRVGRILVAICEDLERDNGPLREVIHRTRPDWILSPIFDTGTGEKRWSGKRAADLSNHGATVVVAAPSGLARLERPGDTIVTIGLIASGGRVYPADPVQSDEEGSGIHRILPVPPPP